MLIQFQRRELSEYTQVHQSRKIRDSIMKIKHSEIRGHLHQQIHLIPNVLQSKTKSSSISADVGNSPYFTIFNIPVLVNFQIVAIQHSSMIQIYFHSR